MAIVDATCVHSTELSTRRPPRRQPWLAVVHKLNVVRHQRPSSNKHHRRCTFFGGIHVGRWAPFAVSPKETRT